MRADATCEHRVAVDVQMLRRDGGRDIGPRCGDEIGGVFGGDMFKDDAQIGKVAGDACKSAFDKDFFAVKYIDTVIGDFAMDQQRHVNRLHPFQHALDVRDIGYAMRGIGGGVGRIKLGGGEDALLCAAPDYFAKLPKPLQPEMLNHVDWLAFGNQQKQMRLKLVAPDGSSTRIAVMPRLQCNDLDALYRAARSGMGVIMLPKQILIEDFAETRLVPVLPEYRPEAGYPSSIWALSAPGPRVSAKVRVFWEYMLESLAHKL